MKSETGQWITTKEAASRLGISLSTFKRMCDTNDLAITRTPGGHRRIDRMQFEHVKRLVGKQGNGVALEIPNIEEIVCLLLQADYPQLIERFYRAEPLLPNQVRLLEDSFVPALWRVGDLWQRGKLSIAEEKVCTSTAGLVLDGLLSRFALPTIAKRIFVGASFVKSSDTMASKLLMLALMSINIRPIYLGCNVAPEFIADVAKIHHADAVWISHTHITDLQQAIQDHETLRSLLPIETRVIVGGGAISPSVRRSLEGCIYYESLDLVIKQEKNHGTV